MFGILESPRIMIEDNKVKCTAKFGPDLLVQLFRSGIGGIVRSGKLDTWHRLGLTRGD